MDIANAIDDHVDVIVSGHTHTAYNCTIDGKLVTQALSPAGSSPTSTCTSTARRTSCSRPRRTNEIVTRDVTPDFLVASLVQHYTDLAAPLQNRVIGSITGDLTHPASARSARPARRTSATSSPTRSSPPPDHGQRARSRS